MITSYTYKIVATYPELGTMDILFSSDGYPDLLVGATMPITGQTIEDVVRAYAPLGQWIRGKLGFVEVPVDTTGVIEVPVATAQEIAVPSGIQTI
jgi:hypothetical protein